MRIDSAGTIWQVCYFKDVPLKSDFHCNGNRWTKKSSRTARLTSPIAYADKVFYFNKRDICEKKLKQATKESM
jgi:hypothetical protein